MDVGVRLIVFSFTSPSILVIAVIVLYVDATLAVASVLDTAVALNVVIVAGLSASSAALLHVNTRASWPVPVAAPVKVIVRMSAVPRPLPELVTTASVRVGLPLP
jgi:hypothetical protein